MITNLYGYLRANSLLFYGGLFGVFFFLTGLFAPTFLTDVLNEVNQNLLAVFRTNYLYIGLISVIAALFFFCWPLRKQGLVTENPAYFYFTWFPLFTLSLFTISRPTAPN